MWKGYILIICMENGGNFNMLHLLSTLIWHKRLLRLSKSGYSLFHETVGVKWTLVSLSTNGTINIFGVLAQ